MHEITQKVTRIALNTIIFVFKSFSEKFREYIWTENPNYKNENIERKYLNNIEKNQFLKVKNSLLELEKDFIELKDKELNNRDVKIEREMEEVLLNQILCP